MAPWLVDFGNVLLGLLPGFLLLRISNYELLGPLWFVADDKARVGQGRAALCVCLGAKSGPADLVGLGKVGYVVLFGAHWRVAGLGAPWRRRCI